MGRTVIEKIAQSAMTAGPEGRGLRAGDFLSMRPRHVMTHDNTSAVMKKFNAIGVAAVADPGQPVFVLDHDIQNTSEANLAKYRSIESFASKHGIAFYPAGSGIGHQVMCEQLYATPGSLVVASDSHSNMYGAMGALGTPVVRTDAAAIWATGEFWWQIPRTVQVVLEGKLAPGATGKDVIITLCGRYSNGEVLNAAVEFGGPGVAGLSMEERMTIANMTTEWGALAGWFPIDAVTIAYIRRRLEILGEAGASRVTPEELSVWQNRPVAPDEDAEYAARITLDLASVSPHVSGPDTVQVMTSLAELEKKRVAIQKAYLISCVNSRLNDLREAARALQGRKVAPGVSFYVASASREVQQQAEEDGTWKTLVAAGAQPLPSGCGPCIGLGTGLLEPGEVGISATNRNFKGRMGSREAKCYLASPAVVAASAAAGFITGPQPAAARALRTGIETRRTGTASSEKVAILDGFPGTIRGRLLFLPQDNLNTDGIYGKDYTYREDMTPSMMAQVVMANYDPGFADTAKAGDILVGGANFGTGSSREQAVTALQAKGIALLVAASFSQTYLRNAFNNGFACVECPDLVAYLRQSLAGPIQDGARTIIAGEDFLVDFSSGTIEVGGRVFNFPPLGTVPQSLVVSGGVENQVRARLGLGNN